MSEKEKEPSGQPPPYTDHKQPQGPPPQAYGVQPQGFGAEPQFYGAPPRGYGAPQQGYGTPQYGYGQPQQGYLGTQEQGQYPSQGLDGQKQGPDNGPPPGQAYTWAPQGQPYGQTVVMQQPMQTNMIVVSRPRPTNWTVPAIFACLCCFWPTGICAIVSACDANSTADGGNMEEAEAKAMTARKLVYLTIALGILCYVILAILRLVLNIGFP